jgi:radical SAM superfamily enzyme YgiQ (UPF0313 family)
MNILLVNCPTSKIAEPAIQPFGLFYIYDALTKNGYNCDILDIDGHGYSKEEVSAFIKKNPHDIVGIGGLATIYPYLHWLIPEIKRINPKAEIILGGAVSSSLSKRCFEAFDIDFEVIGEGEVTIVELIKEITTGRRFDHVKGIVYKKDGEVVFNEKRPLMKSLDHLPRFDENLFPIENYLKHLGGYFHIHTERGCPHNCTFCYNNFRVVSNRVRYRPYKDVVDEIEYLFKKYNKEIKIFNLSGECITANKKWLIKFCKELIKREIKIKYRVNSRVDTIDEERLEWLKKSGCEIISFGIESGSNKILKIINKKITPEQGKKAVSLAKKYIKNVKPSFMLGYLGEDKYTLRKTVKYIKQLKVPPGVFYTTVFPGTELYKLAVERGKIKNEEEYLMRVDMLDFNKYSLNLTTFADEDAENILKNAYNSIANYYALRRPWLLFSRLKNKGIRWTAKKVFYMIKQISEDSDN